MPFADFPLWVLKGGCLSYHHPLLEDKCRSTVGFKMYSEAPQAWEGRFQGELGRRESLVLENLAYLFLLSDHPAQTGEDALCGPPVAAVLLALEEEVTECGWRVRKPPSLILPPSLSWPLMLLDLKKEISKRSKEHG